MSQQINGEIDGGLTLGFIGFGKMAKALKDGFVSAGIVSARDITISRRQKDGQLFSDGTRVAACNTDVVRNSRVVIVAVKPYQVVDVLQEVAPAVTADHIFISVAAGITIDTMQKVLGEATRVVRVMPNTPSLVGCGVAIFSMGRAAMPADGATVRRLFSSVGMCECLPESLMSAVTGLSGSGPAYFFLALESMVEGAVKLGLPQQLATKMAAYTMMGAARMVLETGSEPSALRDDISSPGGTTVAALRSLRQAGFGEALVDAMQAATTRADEIANGE